MLLTKKQHKNKKPAIAYRPGVEVLEDRLVLAPNMWTGRASSSWLDGRNWTAARAPIPQDNVVFGGGGAANRACEIPANAGPRAIATLAMGRAYTGQLRVLGTNTLSVTGSGSSIAGGAIIGRVSFATWATWENGEIGGDAGRPH